MTKEKNNEEKPVNPFMYFLYKHWKVLIMGILLGTTVLYFRAYLDMKESYNFCAVSYNYLIEEIRLQCPLLLQNITG